VIGAREPLDPEIVAALRRAGEQLGNQELLAQLAGLFTDNAPLRLEEIRGAIGRRDAPRAERAAHTLRTNCAVLGASELAACCGRLEEAAACADFDAASARLAEAEDRLPDVLAAVTALAAEKSD